MEKIHLYNENEVAVCNGGTLMEIAYLQGQASRLIDYLDYAGFSTIEISNGVIEYSLGVKERLIKQAKDRGLKVYSEVGKKHASNEAVGPWIDEAIHDLKAGADKIILESRASGDVGIYSSAREVREEFISQIVQQIGLDNIIFEAPWSKQQAYLIKKYGPLVNFGNVRPEDVVSLETLRRGLRADTLQE